MLYFRSVNDFCTFIAGCDVQLQIFMLESLQRCRNCHFDRLSQRCEQGLDPQGQQQGQGLDLPRDTYKELQGLTG